MCHGALSLKKSSSPAGFSLSAVATWLNYLWKDKIRPDPKVVRACLLMIVEVGKSPSQIRTRNTSNIIWRNSKALVGRRGCVATLLLSPLVHIAYLKVRFTPVRFFFQEKYVLLQYTQLTPAEIYERCVRIRHNKSSMHPDRLAFVRLSHKCTCRNLRCSTGAALASSGGALMV